MVDDQTTYPRRNTIFYYLKFKSYISIYLYIYKWAYRCLSVYLSVGMWRGNRNPNPCTNPDEILHTHPYLSKKGFGLGLTPTPWGWGGA